MTGKANKNRGNQEERDNKRTMNNSQSDNFRKNIESIMEIESRSYNSRSGAEQAAAKITAIAGSTPFIIFHIIWFAVWILLNTDVLPGVKNFDPFPFSFLTLVVSLEAIFLTLLVLMSQNRMTHEANKREHLDLQINLLAEQESTLTLQILKRISSHLGIPEESGQEDSLAETTDINQLVKTLEEKSPHIKNVPGDAS